MTRSILAGLAAVAAIPVLCGTGCQTTGVGDPCIPESEYDPSYLGASVDDVDTESKSYQCQSFMCLVNHFQGRVTCPYGQAKDGSGNGPAQPCLTPIQQPVTGMDSYGNYVDPVNQATVLPNCQDRQVADAVYCSCRCQNVDGKTDDGFNYCTCPSGFTCTQLVSSIGATFEGLTGAYCVKNNTDFNINTFPGPGACTPCDPTTASCGPAQGVGGK
ncbi:MAG: hypothetical protein FWD17_09780 [Polyangiaceae bacterium]|nr:hypothetical protein [Polyangiaceae bacterium]